MHLRNSCTRSTSRWSIFHSTFGRGENGGIFLLTLKFHDTSVTRSLITGKLFIGGTVMGSLTGSESRRVLHVRRGPPLPSAEQEPHSPALQFQRTARSSA